MTETKDRGPIIDILETSQGPVSMRRHRIKYRDGLDELYEAVYARTEDGNCLAATLVPTNMDLKTSDQIKDQIMDSLRTKYPDAIVGVETVSFARHLPNYALGSITKATALDKIAMVQPRS